MRAIVRLAVSYTVLVLLTTSQALSQERVLTLDDYGSWNRIRAVSISPNGAWVTYSYEPNDGDATLYIRELSSDKVFERTNGSNVAFSADSRWIALFTSPKEEEAERLREQRKPVPRTFHLINLFTNDSLTIENASSFEFAEGGGYVAVLKTQSDDDAEHDGADLVLRNLATGVIQVVGNVTDFSFDESGSKLGYLVDAANASGNGLYVAELASGRTWPVSTDTLTYSQLSWNEDGTAVAALVGAKPDSLTQRENSLLIASGFANGSPDLEIYDPSEDNRFPEDMVLSEFSDLDWNDNGSILFVGIKEQKEDPKAAEDDEDEEEKANVDVWHWADERIQSVQENRAGRDRRRTWLSAYHVGNGRLIRLENDSMRNVTAPEIGRWAVGENDATYRFDLTQQGGRADYYRVDLRSGETEPIVDQIRIDMGQSPDGEWFIYQKESEIFVHHLESGNVTNLSEVAGVDFLNMQYDIVAERPVYGVEGWSADGESVILRHRYDLWNVSLEGEFASNLTGGIGTAEDIRFRIVDLDPDEEAIDLNESLLLSAYGEWTKRSGYYRLSPGGTPEPLIFEDRMIGNLIFAEDDTDQFIFTKQTFQEFPDWWESNSNFSNPRKFTDANPQLPEFAWGRRVLIDFTDQRGNRLQGTLALPANYQEGQRYPMIVYIYSLMSQNHYRFSMPVYDDRPHMSTYASNGYLVFQPDIVYEAGKPGTSALDDVTTSVQRVIELGYADPERIGLQGHSWGGYESSFIVTQTDMFAAVVTGAPLTNLMSMYNILYKGTGNLNGPILQWSQGRMDISPWEDFDAWVRESPLHHAQNISTPFVILHGTDDGAVDWNQGLEFYAAARRLGKEVILLSYPDEPHHLREEANQKDFQIRMKQFFDHHLMGTPAPDWMVEGVPYLDRGRKP
ncbi:MAG: prolyl oligopeptidase family serine peptidase [Myxococcota bacterium]|nr:prolyl oligopeptidase family serine peptidase [Myxococcota bacterium]